MVSARKLILKNTIWSGAGEIISKGSQFLALIILARYLGVVEFGKLSFILSFATFFLIIADFGLDFISVREIARNLDQTKKYASNIFTIKLILAFLTFLSVFIAMQFINKSEEVKYLVYLATAYIIFFGFCEFFYTIFKAWEKFKYEALGKIIRTLSLFALVILLIFYNRGLKEIIWIHVLTALLTLIIIINLIVIKFTKFNLSFDWPFWKILLKESIPLAFSGVFVVIYYRIDTVMLSLMKNDQVVAWYYAPYNLIFGLTFIPQFIMHSFYPKFSQLFHKDKNQLKILYKKTFILVGAIAAVMLISVYFLADKIILLLYGPSYFPSVIALKILVLAVFFSYFSHIFLFTLTAMNRQKIYTYIAAFGCAFNLITNFVFIPKYSFIGASWTTVATEFLTGLLLLIFVTKSLKKYALS